ncbi:MAG: hypothetical protein P1U62_02955 [Alteraurantiacibacter sp. bin_em_oilr2.035]|nr:hypothetical protein [Aurantiacibacter atlanticus]MDF1833826.1 hypothetical protein [Alteraurantiacibacter sp. bin_em_oilr2.035]
MTHRRLTLLRLVLKSAAVLLALNEIRGLILAAPVFYAMYQAGGSLMAIWLGVSSLLGIALSVIVPLFLVRKLEAKLDPSSA